MEAIYRLFALTFIAERAAYANLTSYENHWEKVNGKKIKMGDDNVYDTLLDHWDREFTAHENAKEALLKAWNELTVDQALIAK